MAPQSLLSGGPSPDLVSEQEDWDEQEITAAGAGREGGGGMVWVCVCMGAGVISLVWGSGGV